MYNKKTNTRKIPPSGAVGCGPQEEFRACADIAIGDEEATLPPRPKERSTTPTPSSTDNYEPDYNGPYLWFSLVIGGTCILVALAAMALLYTYYYHADRAKKWLMARRLLTPEPPPVAPPRLKKQSKTALTQIQPWTRPYKTYTHHRPSTRSSSSHLVTRPLNMQARTKLPNRHSFSHMQIQTRYCIIDLCVCTCIYDWI